MADIYDEMSDDELIAAYRQTLSEGQQTQTTAPQQTPQGNSAPIVDYDSMSDDELIAEYRKTLAGDSAPAPASSAPAAPVSATPVSTKEQAIERARQQGEGETGFWGTVGEAALEGLKGGARAAKAAGQGVLGTATGVVRLAGTPVRMATGWDGIHRLADKIDQSYANFGSDALESDYGDSPDHWGYSVGRFGEKMAGTAGSLLGIGGPGLIAKAGKLPGAVRATGAAVQKALPFMFGNDAAVRAYDTARGNGRSKGEAAALAGLNGAIHFIGFKLFENKSLNKMLGMPQEMEAMMPKWAGEAAAAAPQGFNSLARSVRNGMIKYTLAERGKGMLKAGGIMGVQNLLSDPVMQVAEGKSLDDIDFSRTGMAGLEGLEEGALMEGLMGAAAIYKSPKAAREFIADKLYRGKDYKVIGSDGKPHNEPGLLETPQGRMFIMKQNPAATERVLDIVDHDGKPTKAELDAAFLPPDMTPEELKKFAADWYSDLSVEEQRGGDEGILGDHEETEMAQGPSRTDVDLAGVRARAREIREEERDERQAGQLIERQAEQMQRATQEQQAAKEEQDAYDQAMAEHEEGRYLAGKPDPAKTTIEIPDEALKQGAAPEEGKTPTQEKPNETGNGAHEAPAQPEEGTAREPEVGEAADAKAPEPPRGEVPREGVVELPAEEGRQNLTEGRQELTPPEAEGKPAEAQEPAKPAELPKTAQEPSAEARQGEATPTAEKPPEAVSEAPKAEPVPERPAPTNRLKRRDGTDPLVERKTEASKVEEPKGEELKPEDKQAYSGVPERLNESLSRLVTDDQETADDIAALRKAAERNIKAGADDTPSEQDARSLRKRINQANANARESKRLGLADREKYFRDIAKDLKENLKELERNGIGEDADEVDWYRNADFNEIMDAIESGGASGSMHFDPYGIGRGAPGPFAEALKGIAESGVFTGKNLERFNRLAKKINDAYKRIESDIENPRGPFGEYLNDVSSQDTSKSVPEAPAAETTPAPEATEPVEPVSKKKSNRLRRADGTDPLAEKEEQAKKGAETTAPLSRTVRKNLVKRLSPILDLVRNKDGSYNPDALRNRDGNGGLNLKDLKRLHEHPEVIDDLGLKPEAAAALRSAVRKAYEDGYLEYHYQSAHDKLAAYERGSGDLAFVYNAVADAASKAKAKGDKFGESLLQPKLAELVEKVNALPEAERNRILSKAASAANGKLTPMEKKRRASITTVEGKDIDIPTGNIGGIDGDVETQRAVDEAVDRQVRSESSEAARFGRITERDDAAEGGAEKPQGVSRDGNKAGDRHIQLETKGGKKYVVWRNEFDEVVKRAPMDALRALAKASPEMKALVDKLEAGEEIRASKATPESPEERDLRFAADENYQKWLKSRKANDAEPLRERYEGEQAEAFGGVWRNVISGVKGVKYHNEDYKGTEDGREKVRHLRTEDGRVVGTWNRETGQLDLYRGASWKTLNHEFGHAVRQYAEQEAARGNRTLLDKIERCIDEAPQAFKDEIRSRYAQGERESDADYNERIRDEIWGAIREGRNSEVLKNAIKTLQGRAWYNRAWDAIKTAWKGILARMGFNRADLSGIDKMSPEQFNDFLDRTMSEGKTLGRLERGEGEGQRAMLEPGTFQKISDAIKRYKEQGIKFSPDTEAIISMLQRGGRKEIPIDGFETTQLVMESPAFTGGIRGRLDLDHSAFNHNWEAGTAYTGYYTWPEFDRAFRAHNINSKIVTPGNRGENREVWEWNVSYPRTESHEAYNLTWKLVRDTNMGKMLDVYTTRKANEFPPQEIQTPEGAQLGLASKKDTSEASSSGVAERSIAKPEGESQGGEEKIRKSVSSAPAKGNPIDDVRPKGERLQEGAQDSDISIRNLQRDLGGVEDKQTESGHTDAKTTFNEDGTVKELGSTDVYSAKMRMNGHLQAGFNEIKSGQNTIDKTLADNGLTQAQFDKFLYASHAPERNQTIAERMAENANKAEWRKARAEAEKGNTAPLEALRRAVKVDTASKEYSGMSTDEANAYLASPEVASKRAALESAANELYKMERKNLDRLLESGRISKEFYDLLTTRWKKYVPLRTDVEGKDGAAYNLSVGGFRQNEFLTAEGRKTEADSPYTFAMLQVQQGLRGSEANTVHLTAANLVRKAEQQGYHIGDIIEGKESGRGKGWTFQFADGDKVEVGGDMKLAKNRKDIILFKENGELKAIRMVKGANGRGEAVADAITGRNVQQWHKDLAFIPKWTRWLSAMRTQYSPEFIFSNALADHMESTQALIGRYGIKDGGKLAGQALVWEKRNLGDLRRYIKTGDAGNGYVKEAIDAGVLIKGGVAAHGYAGELKDIQSSYDRFVRDAKGFGNMTAKEKASFVWDGLKDFISHTNELIENSTRIGIYSALREMRDANGNRLVSKADAVKFAREATVDFNRKGGYTPWVNGLFMFSNASVQGAVRSVQAMKDTHGKELIGLLVAAGVAKAGLDYFLGNDEDREKEGGRNARNLSEYDKKHKLGIPIPGTSYQVTALRMRGPYAAIPYLAQTFTNVALGETKTADAAKTVVRELTDQATDLLSGNGVFNDKGEFDGALLGQSLAPTLADPLVQLYSGKDYKGDERKARAFDKTMPLSSNGKRNTPVPYKAAAEFINKITGGNENRKGLADIAPEDLQLVVEFLAGGVGRDIGNVVSTGQNIKEFATGGSPERTLSQTPFLRTLTNEYPENTSRYFDALDAYERDKAEFKKTTDIERRREMKKEKPYLFTGKSLLDGQIDKVKELTHLERGEVKSGNKWIEPKTPRSEAQKEKYRELRLKLQATILRQLKA